tara:strand:+ start:1150 stop:2049 length:900 start_codon:yes stop_codon:yes gene_type:complete
MSDEKILKKIIVGTAQFGSNYGISNQRGKIKAKKVGEIFTFLKKSKIKFFDTATNYGNAEQLLGKMSQDKFQIITKLPPLPISEKKVERWVNTKFEKSLLKLNCKKIYSVLLHRPSDLLGDRGKDLFEAINNLKKKGLVSKIGISIYNYEEAKMIVNMYKFDIIQAPFNVIDQRLLKLINFFKKKKIEIHVRSIFLQGLLLDRKIFRSKKFKKWQITWDNWEDFCSRKNLNYIDVAINFAIFQKKIDYFVLGFQDLPQIKEVMNFIKNNSQNKKKYISHLVNNKRFSCLDEKLINPSKW